MIGQMISLSEVKKDDIFFSSKVMGDGIAIVPSKGALYAPVDGEVTLLFETNHALGMKKRTKGLKYYSTSALTLFSWKDSISIQKCRQEIVFKQVIY
ncbi:hypothetical protein BsIDN1_70370 [Bacillus safensis]|uniref:PTS EIIA type-1 domain-containing protein n=1 Tax=Bacillus safensis TaxID=561879 RepID=A0A5S9MMY7_BACIA|nr:hypothetical protein BsIDN1_70370 [Bacillus safensis]